MKIFQTIQRQFANLGVDPPSNQWNRKCSCNKRILCGFLLFGYVILSQFVHIYCTANGFLEYVVSISSTSGSIVIFTSFAAIVSRKTALFECIDNIEKLIDTRSKYPQSKALFLKTNRQVERLSDMGFMVLPKIVLHSVMLSKCFICYGTYFLTDSGSDSFQLTFPMWFPFDATTPIGFLVAFTIEYIIIGYEAFMITCGLTLGIGAYWFAVSATKEIQRVLHSINDKVHSNVNQTNELQKIFFTEFIKDHGMIRQVEHDFSDIFQPTFMSIFTWSLLAISGSLLIFQVEIMHHSNVIPLSLTIFNVFGGLGVVLMGCELGQRMCDAFEEIEFTIDQFDWYLFPIEIRRISPMVIANVQQPVELECFGSVTCTREVFRKIINRAYSYFTVLRQLSN